MMSKRNWRYDEMRHSGVDFSDPARVEAYDRNHQKFRNYQKDAEAIVHILGLGREHTVMDMGAGTGAFALHAARYCKLVYVVDVSRVMLDYTQLKAETEGIDNIVFCHGGFLTYDHNAEPVDAMVCLGVLHHLPDLWKLIGLRRAVEMIKPGGGLYLFDVAFPYNMTDYESQLDDWVRSTAEKVGSDFASEVESTIRDEFVTYDWVMEGMLRRAGFRIDNAEYTDGFGAKYVCARHI